MCFAMLALKNLLRRPMLSVGTAIGIASATMTVVALVGVSMSISRVFLSAYRHAQVDLVVLRETSEPAASFLPETRSDWLTHLPGVACVSPSMMDIIDIPPLLNVPLRGVDADSALLEPVKIIAGVSIANDKPGVVVGQLLAERLGKQVGDTLDLYGNDREIVGISAGPTHLDDNAVVLPLLELQQLSGHTRQVSAFMLSLDDPADRPAVTAAVGAAGLTAFSAEEHVHAVTQCRWLHGMTWITCLVAILLGSIGAINTMSASVLARTREIGLFRTIGWPRRHVAGMLMLESCWLSLAGAALGFPGAACLVYGLSVLPATAGILQAGIPLPAYVLGALVALGMGAVGGACPAWRGAYLTPAEALGR